jgi:predicted secreted hydrolase
MRYRKIAFPRDGAAHDAIIEWWYFNGNLEDERGNEYAFMDCLFKAKTKKVRIPFLRRIPLDEIYFSQSLLLDVRKGRFHSEVQPLSIISRDSFSKPLFFVNYHSLSLEGYQNCEIEETDAFRYRVKSGFFDLNMASTKAPLLEGGRGFLNLDSKQTFYYSLTNLRTEGHVTVDGRRIRVRGKSWMDHQWADVSYSKDKWTWFSIQLDNDVEMVCLEYDNRRRKIRLASISYADGRTAHAADLLLTALGERWESRRTGATYPLSWRIQVPSRRIDLVVSPRMAAEEMIFGTINYWEGPIKVRGKMNGKSVRGRGFLELVGYPTKKFFIGFYDQEIRRIRKLISTELKALTEDNVRKIILRK